MLSGLQSFHGFVNMPILPGDAVLVAAVRATMTFLSTTVANGLLLLGKLSTSGLVRIIFPVVIMALLTLAGALFLLVFMPSIVKFVLG